MTRVADIILRARDSLSDPDARRWSDDRLLRLLDEGQKLIARRARLLRSLGTINLRAGVAEHSLPSDAYLLTRVTAVTGENIKLRSREWMDEYEATWETTTGSTVRFVVFDRLQPSRIRVYPIPTTADGVEFDSIVSDFGVAVTSTGDSFPSDFGVVATLLANSNNTSDITPEFGVLVDQAEVANSLLVHYISKPDVINAVAQDDGSFKVDEAFDLALKHYVIGHALRDDKDSQNRAVGKDEIALFEQEVLEATKVSAADFTQQTQHETFYDGGI